MAEVLWVEPGFALGMVGPTMVQAWEAETQPNGERMTRILEALQRLKPNYPRLFMLAYVGERSPFPDAEGRKVASLFPGYFEFYVGVHSGSSFRMSMVRSAMAALVMMSPVRSRFEVFEKLDEAARRLAKQAHPEINALSLIDEVNELRRVALAGRV